MPAPKHDPGHSLRAPRHEPAGVPGERVTRDSPHKEMYGHRWRKIAAAHLSKEPLCRHCDRRGIVREASHVDHIVPHHGDHRLFHDAENLQSLCASCHGRKTRREQIGAWRSR